ncbi:Na(+)-translocating NADH-quinone reductase subunit C [Paraferrimonas sp. SM1919]|uniref:Na(+)-translocating NADH-quinone reductase subunit C n=1 Tax=Paraferrimonas sp. SM1919 TaxID=2662263 RepID=UPI0013CF816E|nr:Na(+)-translocating NADH-quinone reductase subunit C [Paraferrimonas sp. SM1919]
MSKNNDTFGKTLGVVIGLCLVCSVIVSGAAVALKPLQDANIKLDKQKYLLQAAGYETTGDVGATYEKHIEARLVDLKSGDYVAGDAEAFDQAKAAREAATSTLVADDAGSKVKRVPNTAQVYLVKDEAGQVTSIILPIKGAGLWSTMYAFLALETDMNTVKSLVYYEQGETAGLGSEIQNPTWMALWPGKKVYNQDGEIALAVAKPNPSLDAMNQVDALSGATLTGNGVTNSIHFWLGEEAFGNYIAKVRQGGLE